ncbi:MAG: DUF4347 domain-containing protein [Rivularia sp. (in: cyanobacteria)]
MVADNSQNIWNPKVIDTGLNSEVNSYGLENDGLKEIAFVDSQLSNYQTLIDGFDENVQVFLLDDSENGLNQITQTLENYQGLDAIHLFSHGVAGGVELGNLLLTQDNLGTYQNQLQAWGNSLNPEGDLLFYGCNVAEGTIGQEFLQDVSALTRADVAGSDDLTGNIAYGGDDWRLEYSTGDIGVQNLRGNSSFTEVLSSVNLSDDGKLTFDEGIGIVNIVSLSVVDNNTNLLIKDQFNNLTAGSNTTNVDFNEVKVDLSAIKDIEFKLGFGKDSLSFDSEISFANGQLSSFIIEGEENTLPGLDLVLGDLFGDSVSFNHNLYLGGANLNVSAENITVKENVTISTRQVASGENHLTANSTGKSGELYFTGVNPINFTAALGNIQSVEKIEIGNNAKLLSHVEEDSSYAAADVWLNARYFSNADIDNLFPVTSPEDWAAKTAKITIGDNAALRGNNIVIKAQAEDKNFSELIGADSLLDNFVIAPLQDRLEEALALPVKVLVRRSNASVDVNTGASLVGLAGVSVEAVATTDSTGQAKGSIVSIGYAHAEASAKVNLKTGVEITAGEAVKIGSEGNATASISTETKATNIVGGLSLAVDYAKITSHAVVEQGVTITAGKTANIIALGNKETEAEANSKTSKKGKVSFGFGINISDTDIKADVDGTIIANQNPGAIVKFELDPLKEVTYEFNPTETSVVNTTENTIDLTGVAHSLRTGDKIKYTTQAGNNIGGLENDNDKEYYVVVDPQKSNLIRLANSRTDAFAVANALKASDNSVITSKTVDLNSIGSLSITEFAASSAVDGDKDIITFNTTNKFKIGQPVIYKKNSGNVIPGLNDGQVYYVITYSNTDSQQTIQLAETATLARQGIAIDIGNATGSHSLSPLHQFTAKVTDIDTDSIDLAKVFDITDPTVTPHALATGDEVNYTNRRGISIGGVGLGVLLGGETGLVDGEDYYIVTDPNNTNIIRLASSELKALEAYSKLEDDANADLSNLVIDFTDNGGDVAAVNSKTFDPTEIGIVDDTQNTIILDNAAFPEGSDVFGTDADFNIFGSTFEIGQAVVYSSGGGKPIGGLEDGKTYYVVTATDENNLDGDNRFFVGKQIIQLADTENKAHAGISLDIDPSVATSTEHSFTATHVIDSGLVAGVGVLANLSSSDTSVAESEMNDGDEPGEEDFSLDLIEKAGGTVSGVAKKIFDKLVNGSKNGDYKNKSDAGGNNPEPPSSEGDDSGKSPLAVAGALGFAYVNNDVIANVGSNAILKSAEDLEVVGTIEHEVKLNADSDVANIADNSGSAAVVVGIYTNNADAIVNSNAQLDAYKASRVIAEVKYPYLTRPDEYIPANLGEFVDLVKSDGYDAVNDYLDGTLGLKSKLLNTWARSTASADNIGVSGSVNLLIFNNDVNAIVKEDAKINQDLAWREKSEDQSLSVEATNYMQMLNLTGVFKFALPSLELDLGKVEGSSWTPKQIKENNQLLGADGKTGMGGAFFLMFLDNNTNAIVENGVSIYSGAAGGFNMKAEEAIMNFNFTQAGSKAESYGIGGSFAYVNQNSNTLAQLSGGTRVEGRSANISAGSLETHINWAGGVAVGKNLGFGITVAINDIDRSTDAIIGDYDPSKDKNNQATPLENTYIYVTDGVTVDAVSDGWLGAFSVAAAVADATPKQPKKTKEGDISETSEATGKQSKPTSAIGVSGDVSYNQVDDKVRAIVWDAGLLEASTIALSALNETDLYSVAGAVAFAKGGQGKTSFGLAGAASWNEMLGEAKAYIKGQGANKQLKLNADQLTLDAKQKGEIFAITAGGSGAFANGAGNNVSLAGSFSYNEIENTTESYLDGVNTTISNSAKSVLNITPQSAIANDTINLDKSHGWLNGEKVIYDNGGDSQDITGLVSGKAYYVITDSDNPNSFKLASTEADAKNNIALFINGAGITGTSHSFTANNPLPIGFEGEQIELDETKENTITFSKNHDWKEGTAVIYDNGGGKSISGLTHGNTYYVVTDNRDGKVLKLATNSDGTNIVNLDPSVAEGEGHRFYEASTPSSDQIIDFGEEHNWYNSDIVTYRNENGTAIGGLEDGEKYYVIVVNSTKIKLAKTPGGDAIDLNFRAATGDKHSLQRSVVGNNNYQLFTFDPVKDNAFNLSQVEVKENFALDEPHDFNTGQAVIYDNGGGTSIGGLTNGETYYVIVDEDPNTFRLANSEIEAKLGFAIGLDPTTMTGDNHQFFPNSSVISAKDKSKIFAVAGTAILSLGGKKGGGFGLGFAWNDIDNTTKALVQNSTLSHDDSLQVIASNNSDIQTISASIGISQAQQSAGTVAGTASVNFIDNVTEAAIINTNNGTVDDTSGLLRVKAVDEADIKSLSGAVSVAISGKTSLGFGAAVAYNVVGTQSGHSTKAYIAGSSIYVEDLDVTADSNQLIQSISATVAGTKSGKAAILLAGSVSINIIGDTQTAAYISGSPNIVVDQGINITAKNEAKIQSIAGQVAVSFGSKGGGVIGAAVAVNEIDKTSDSNNEIGVYAYIDSSKVTLNSDSDININAVSTSTIETISAGVQIGGGAKLGVAAGGSVSLNTIVSTVSSYIANNADVTATKRNINLKAEDKSNIRAVAGQAAVALGKAAGAVGVAWADNDIKNQVKSYIDKSKVTTSSGSINVNAESTATIETLSAGAQVAGGTVGIAAGGSRTINTIANTISSYISNSAEVTANQNLDIKAKDESTIRSIAGQVAIALGKGAAGVGVAWATNEVNNQVNSYINQKSQVTTNIGSININANSNADIQTISAGIQVAGGAFAGAGGGSVSSNTVENKINSYIAEDTDVRANQNLDIKAKDESNIIAIAGQAAIALGKAAAAVGVAWADNDIKNQVNSYIDKSKVVTNSGSINVSADSTATIKTLSAGAQIAGGAVGIAGGGSTSINTVENTVSSYIGNNSNVTAEQNINLKTNDNSTISALAGQVAIAVGKGSGTIGVALAENDIENNINSYIEGSTVKSNKDSIDINAISKAKIETLSAVASVSGGIVSGSVAVSISHNQIKNKINSFIINSTDISAQKDITIQATDNSEIKSLSGGAALAISIGGGAGAAYSYNNIDNETQAYTNSTLNSQAGNIVISADSKGTIETIAVSMGASLVAGGAGSIAINEMANQTSAYVDGGNLTAYGSIGISSQSRNEVTTYGGALSGGIVGFGATVVVNNIDNDTKAYTINNANLAGKGHLSLDLLDTTINGVSIFAANKEDIEVKSGTASLGGFSFAGTVVVNSIENTTQAYADGGKINDDLNGANNNQNVWVKAFSDGKIDVLGGALSIGKAGIGGTIDINSIINDTRAYIGDNATVKAKNNILVEAIGSKTVDSMVVAGTVSGTIGFAGAVSINTLGSSISQKGIEAADKASKTLIDQIKNIDQYSDKISTDKSIIDLFNIRVVKHGTQAFTGNNANLQAGGNIAIQAKETSKVSSLAGGGSIGLVGVGGAVSVIEIKHNTQAFAGSNTVLDAQGDIKVKAEGDINSDPEVYAGAAGAIGLGAAVSYLTTKNNTSAYIGAGTTINQANNVNVLAGSSSNLKAEGWGAAAGAGAVGVVIANAKESGTTEAYLGSGVKIENTNNLNVKATAKHAVSAVSQAAAGGILSGNGSVPTATVSPTVKAYIGDNSNIQVNNDVEVISDVTVDGDAEAKGVSIGAVAVGASIAKVNAKPNIDTYVGANAVINAKDITVESRLGEPIKVPDTSFNPGSAVNTTQNTVTFKDNHGLDTGDSLVYGNGGGNDISGLQNENSYNVIRVDGKTVKLGSEFNAAEVDVKFNTIKFSGNHGFKDDDEVIYQASGGSAIGGLVSNRKYYVRVIDSNTIKLSTNSSYSANTQGTNLEKIDTSSIETNINIENHGFQNNDVISYQRRTAQFNVVEKISEDAKGKDNIFNLSNDIASSDTIKSASHGFQTNDKVIYTTTGTVLGGLENGKEYYVIKVDDNNFKLSTELSTSEEEAPAVDDNSFKLLKQLSTSEEEAPAIDITSAEIDTSHKITAVGLKIEEVEQFDFTYTSDTTDTNNTITLNNHGFTDSQEVVYQTDGTALDGLTVGETYYIKTIDANKFQLLAQDRTAIDLGANNENHQLVIKKGVQELEEGVSYYVIREDENNFKLSTTKDGTALTLSKEHLNGNGFNHLFAKDDVIDLTSASIGKHNFHIDLTSIGSGDKHILSAGASATVPSQGDNKFSVYAQASAGALIGGNATTANVDITPTMKTYVGDQALMTASGNVKITSLSSVEATGTSNSKIAGAIAVGSSEIKSNINNNNNTYVGSGVQITADGNVDITGQSDQTLNISGYGGAGSAITFADADAHATVNHNTDTKINNGANIVSNDTLTVRSSSNTNGNVKVKADGVGAYADADADSSIKFDGSNDTTVNGKLEARRLNVEAVVDTLKVESRSESYGAGAIGNIDAKAKVDLSGSNAVVNLGSGAYLKGDYVTLDAKYKTVQSNAIALADCDGLGGDTDTTADNIMPINAEVVTDANSTLEVYELDVIADFENFNRTTTAESDKAFSITIWNPFGDDIEITMDFGSEERRERYEPKPIIDFNSNVILDRRDVNPVLIIDENGNIAQKSENITINNTNTEIIVNDIDNVKVGGINFIIPRRADEAFNNGSFIDRGKYEVKDPAYETVQITNNSNKDLVINDISVINIVGLPEIEYNQVNVNNKTINPTNISPQEPLAVNPTIVTIENNNSNSNLVLQGTIDSPHDRIELVSTGGIIGRDGHKIITRDLSLTAENGSIGTDSQRIVAQINQGYEPVTEDVPSENINVQIEAKDSVFLDLTAKQIDNNPVNVNVEKMTATQGDVNLLINQTTNSFNTAVSALYEFNKIISGKDIIINAGTTSTNIKGNTDFIDNTSFLDDEALTNIDGNTANIAGLLDVVTGGSINLTEVEGGLNLKQVISANEDIQITALETEILGEDLLLIDNAKVSAAKDITLLIGDDFQINSTAQIKSDQKVVIKADYNNQDTDGSLVNIFGAIYSQWTELYTEKDFDTFNVHRIDSKTYLRSSSGDDTINVGSKYPTNRGLLDNIDATLTISGGIGYDILNVDDSGDTTNNIAILNDTQINGLGMNGEINYGSFEQLNLELGAGSDILAVETTHDGETNINTGEGNENVYVEAIYGQTTVRTSSGDDNITVSNPEQMLEDISARLTLSGGIGSDNLSVDDSGDTTNNIAILNDTQINGLGMNGEINYGSFEQLNLELGSGNDILAVETTHDGETNINTGEGNENVYVEAIYGQTTVRTSSGDDNITVSNPEQMLNDISAKLTLSGGVGRDNLSVDDSGDTTNNIAIVNDTQINGLGMNGEIDYGSFEKLNLELGSGSDILAVESTHDGETDINTGAGNEKVYIEAIYGKTTVETGKENDRVNVEHSNLLAAVLMVDGKRWDE